MILDKEGNLTTQWRTFLATSTHGALSYLEATKMLMDFQNSLNRMGETKDGTRLLKVICLTTVCDLFDHSL